jgi:GDPmannose 4,6-dehydratase
MWLMLQQDGPKDYVISTGQTHSVEELVEVAFSHVGLNWRDYVVQDPRFMRPAEVDLLIGDATLAKKELGWQPEVTFEELIRMIVEADVERIQRARHMATYAVP